MRYLSCRSVQGLAWFGSLTLLCFWGPARAAAGGCAVSDASNLPSAEGCLLAFAYNQKDDDRLVVIDEINHRRYETPLKEPGKPPFWDHGKVFVVHPSGVLQGFQIVSKGLVAEKPETISDGAVFSAEFSGNQHRLYLIRTTWDVRLKKFVHDLLAIDFPTRKPLWTKRIDDPGLLSVMERYVCVMGPKLVQLFDCDTGEKIAGVEAAKATVEAGTNVHK